jgi:hypothetical protein
MGHHHGWKSYLDRINVFFILKWKNTSKMIISQILKPEMQIRKQKVTESKRFRPKRRADQKNKPDLRNHRSFGQDKTSGPAWRAGRALGGWQTDRQTRTGRQTDRAAGRLLRSRVGAAWQTDRQTRTDRQTGSDRQPGRPMDRQTVIRQTDRQTRSRPPPPALRSATARTWGATSRYCAWFSGPVTWLEGTAASVIMITHWAGA